MKRVRSVMFGMPVYVIRKMLMPLFVVNGALIVFFSVISWNDSSYLVDLVIKRPRIALYVIVLPSLFPMLTCIVFAVRVNRYTKRMKRLGGRVCFGCDYEIAEGLDSCSECGAEWSMDDLSKGWRKMAEKGGGD